MIKRIYMKLKLSVLLMFAVLAASAQEFNRIPNAWKWIGDEEAVFTFNGEFTDSTDFSVNARTGMRKEGVNAPEKYTSFPVNPEGAVNLTYSPDSTMLAFTRDNDLYVVNIADGKETRLTHDGSDVILNGYASWVYYEEIFGRATRYKAFWWSPDSRKLAFYRFDNSQVPMFPIYSAFANPQGAASQSQSPKVTDLALGGALSETRYPKAGQTNPTVRIAVADISTSELTWADFDSALDQYFGPPFWSPDSREFFVPRMPRLQNTLDLYAVNPADGSKRHVYNETYKTWLTWIYSAVFTDKGLYMVREFETDWQQIYFLSYDGTVFKRLTDGPNWDVDIVRVDQKSGDVYFTAKRDAVAKQALYKVDKKGVISALTDPAYNALAVSFSPNGKYFVASYSNITTPTRVGIFPTSGKGVRKPAVVADMKGPDYDASKYALGQLVFMTTEDGFRLPGMMVYPKDFDPTKKYPVHVDIYGGPDSPQVRDRWVRPNSTNQWWSENGIIQITVDPRAAGHNGRKGLDMIYRQLTVHEIKDFCAWADWLKALPYVDGDKIGVEGFSFGGTMTCMLLMQAPDRFHYGVAGGGVYDWALYDSHYTERYMDTPQNNPEGYAVSKVLNYVSGYPVTYTEDEGTVEPVMLKITHGTGDDNVHHQNTLQLLDQMHRINRKFDFMIYPDGMHGYRGYQGLHFKSANRDFWKKYLLGK
jgi:dipeptidyl-peptidase-4